MRIILILSSLVAVLAIQAPAAAQDVRIVTVPVHAGDRADPATLRSRVDKAIDVSCGTYAAAPYAQWTDIGRCRKQAKVMSDQQITLMLERDKTNRLAVSR